MAEDGSYRIIFGGSVWTEADLRVLATPSVTVQLKRGLCMKDKHYVNPLCPPVQRPKACVSLSLSYRHILHP